MKQPEFSIVIPTFTGEEHISKVFDSILQQNQKHAFEVVVVIDGPNLSLRRSVNKYQKTFDDESIPFRVYQFQKNKGRFYARFYGAKHASAPQLLFADDRCPMDKEYFASVTAAEKAVLIPNVIQIGSDSGVNRLLYLLRKRLYKQWGDDFRSYYIDSGNFEKSSKGTTGLWISKELFLDVCQEITSRNSDLKNANEDTGIFREIIDRNIKIYRSSESKIYYQPRTGFKQSTQHLYERGPRFVDYYFKKGTRFFYPLVASLLLGILLIGAALYRPKVIIYALVAALFADVAITIGLAKRVADMKIMVFLPIVVVAFACGVVKGIVIKLENAVKEATKP